MLLRQVFWLSVPLLGLGELALHVYFAGRAPNLADWNELVPLVEQARQAGDLVVVAPDWADPLARQTFGEDTMPLADVARADVSGYAHAVEISLLGQRAAELQKWRELELRKTNRFEVRRLENPEYEAVLFDFVDHVEPSSLFVAEWNGEAERPCPFTSSARATAGGLPGHVTYPRERFHCLGGERYLVGVTVIDDQNYRPRRCIFAHPLVGALLHLRFANVPIGTKLRGYAGQSFLLARDGGGAPVEFAAYIDGKEVGRRPFFEERGFDRFEFPLDGIETPRGEVTFEVQSKSPETREFCFQVQMR
jgi:hypothetical protein